MLFAGFVHDRLRSNRRFRVLAVGDDCTRENLALEPDFALSGERITRVLDRIAELRRLSEIDRVAQRTADV